MAFTGTISLLTAPGRASATGHTHPPMDTRTKIIFLRGIYRDCKLKEKTGAANSYSYIVQGHWHSFTFAFNFDSHTLELSEQHLSIVFLALFRTNTQGTALFVPNMLELKLLNTNSTANIQQYISALSMYK